MTDSPSLEIRLRAGEHTSVGMSPSRTVIRLRRGTLEQHTALVAAALVIRQRLGTVDRMWRGDVKVSGDGDTVAVSVTLLNRMGSKSRQIVVTREEILRRREEAEALLRSSEVVRKSAGR